MYSRYVQAISSKRVGDRVVENVMDSVASILYYQETEETSSPEAKSIWNSLMEVSVPIVLSSMPSLLQENLLHLLFSRRNLLCLFASLPQGSLPIKGT